MIWLPLLLKNWRLFAIGGAVLAVVLIGWRFNNAAWERGYAASSAACESARLAAETAVAEAVRAANEKGRLAGIEEGKRLTEAEVEIRTVTRDVVRRIEVPITRVVTVESCPLDAVALEEIRAGLNEQRRRVQ